MDVFLPARRLTSITLFGLIAPKLQLRFTRPAFLCSKIGIVTCRVNIGFGESAVFFLSQYVSDLVPINCIVFSSYHMSQHVCRSGYSKSNPRKMVKMWAEKETRNLRRLHTAGLPCPNPLLLRLHGASLKPFPRIIAQLISRSFCSSCDGFHRKGWHRGTSPERRWLDRQQVGDRI